MSNTQRNNVTYGNMVKLVACKHTIWFRKMPATNTQYGQTRGLRTHNIVQHEVCKQHNTTQHNNMVKLVACKHTLMVQEKACN